MRRLILYNMGIKSYSLDPITGLRALTGLALQVKPALDGCQQISECVALPWGRTMWATAFEMGHYCGTY